MQKPAEVKYGCVYVYGVQVTAQMSYPAAVKLTREINAAAAAYREHAVLAIKAGGCA